MLRAAVLIPPFELLKVGVEAIQKMQEQQDRWDKTEYHGYVDHQSYGVLDAALSKFNVSIEDFIFND